MFIRISKIDVGYENANHLYRPDVPDQPMVLALCRMDSATVFFRHYNKRVFAEYRETPSQKIIPRRKWTPEMRQFAQEKVAQFPKQKSESRITIFGWIFLALMLTAFGFLIFDKPDHPQTVFDNLDEPVKSGDVYFGRFQESNDKGSAIIREGNAWFKIKEFVNDTAYIQLGRQSTESSFGADKISSTDFEEKVYATTIREQKTYNINFRTKGSVMMFDAGRKKE